MAAGGPSLGDAYIDMHANTAPMKGDITRGTQAAVVGAGPGVTKAGTKVGRTGGIATGLGFVKGIMGPLLAASAVIGTVKFFGASLREANEAQVAHKQTTAVIKSMGGVANVTVREVESLAASIGRMVAIDNDAIQAGQNLLLSFGNIRNEVGKGNDMFNQASMVMVDFAARFGVDIPSAAKLVGKALNDPVRGLTALQRAGVQFSESEKEVIKRLVEKGDILGAQKLIMRELTRETEGAAKANITQTQRMSVAWQDFQEVFGKYVTSPIMDQIAKFVTTVLPALTRGTESLGKFFASLGGGGKESNGPLAPGVKPGDVPSLKFKPPSDVESFMGSLARMWENLKPTLDEMGTQLSKLMEAIGPLLSDTADIIMNDLIPAIEDLTEALGPLGEALTASLGPGMISGINGFLLAVQGILQALTGSIEWFTGLITGDWGLMWQGLLDVASGIGTLLFGVVTGIFGGIVALFMGLAAQIPMIWDGIWTGLQTALITFVGWLQTTLSGAWQGIVTTAQAMWSALPGVIMGILWMLVGQLTAPLGAIWGAVSGAFTRIWGTVNGWMGNIVSAITGGFGRALGAVTGAMGQIVSQIGRYMTRAWQAVQTGINVIVGIFGRLVGWALSAISGMVNVGYQIANGIYQGFMDAWGWVSDAILGAIGNLMDRIPVIGKIFSPSKITVEVGEMIAKGLAVGMLDGMTGVEAAASRMMGAAIPNTANGSQGNLSAPIRPSAPEVNVSVAGPDRSTSLGDMRLQARLIAEALEGSEFRLTRSGNLQLLSLRG